MKLSDIKSILSERDLKLSKSLGQNFLHDQNQLRRIAAAGEITAADKIFEIGPGLGPLTELLVATGAEVLAIEKDRRLFDFLTPKFSGAANLKLLNDDALEYVRVHRDWRDWKLVANLPYSVASPILVELAQAEHPPRRMVATLQLEVAQRIVAEAGGRDYGVFSLLIQLHYQRVDWFKIPSSCFFPEPDVDSACVVLELRPRPILEPALHRKFTALVKQGFSQRRKMMFKLLKAQWAENRLSDAFEKVGISRQIRAEAVTLQQFIDLVEILCVTQTSTP